MLGQNALRLCPRLEVGRSPTERSDVVARDGIRIFDADTHVGPSMDVLERYLSAAERAALEPLKRQAGDPAQRPGDVSGR